MIEGETPEVPQRWPGSFVVDLDGSMIGRILLRRATGHRRPVAAGKAGLGYLAWDAEQWLGLRTPATPPG